MMTFGSLFAGIGGIDLGLERAGLSCRWQVENDDFCRRVLAKHWPAVPRYGDIRSLDFRTLPPVDLVAGGFPCQPVSAAGKKRVQADARWLWPDFARAVRVLRPRFVLVENVPGLLVRGFADVLRDLAALGYDAEWDCLSAADVGAPHLRLRVFLIAWLADAQSDGREPRRKSYTQEIARGREPGRSAVEPDVLADPNGQRFEERQERDRREDSRRSTIPLGDDLNRRRDPLADAERELYRHGHDGAPAFLKDQTSGDEGVGRALSNPHDWSVEPDVGRVAYGVPSRVDRLRGLGNAVVPQCAEVIGRMIIAKAGD